MRTTVLVLVSTLLPPLCFGDLAFDPRTADADAQRLRQLVSKCEGESSAFREMMDAIRRSSRPVPVFPGRDQPGVFIDVFGTGAIDLSDLEKYVNPRKDPESGKWVFPPGVDPEAATLCENLAHVLYERFHGNYVGGQYKPSHDAANGYESRVRQDFGQHGTLVECTGPANDAISIYSDGEFIIEHDTLTVQPNGSIDVGPIRTTRAKVICVGGCPGGPPRRKVYAAADDCAACEADLANQCGGRVAYSGCRTK